VWSNIKLLPMQSILYHFLDYKKSDDVCQNDNLYKLINPLDIRPVHTKMNNLVL